MENSYQPTFLNKFICIPFEVTPILMQTFIKSNRKIIITYAVRGMCIELQLAVISKLNSFH